MYLDEMDHQSPCSLLFTDAALIRSSRFARDISVEISYEAVRLQHGALEFGECSEFYTHFLFGYQSVLCEHYKE